MGYQQKLRLPLLVGCGQLCTTGQVGFQDSLERINLYICLAIAMLLFLLISRHFLLNFAGVHLVMTR